jgi:hypothetical protein
MAGFDVTRAGESDPIPSIRFRYEGQSTATGASAFRQPKTDYSWGEVAKRGMVARLFGNNFYRSDPKDSSMYIASTSEHFVLDANTVIACQKNIEFKVQHAPRSLEEAKAIHKSGFSNKGGAVQTLRYVEAVPSAAKTLLQHHFLGMTPDGPIRTLSKAPRESLNGRPVFEYTSGDGTNGT